MYVYGIVGTLISYFMNPSDKTYVKYNSEKDAQVEWSLGKITYLSLASYPALNRIYPKLHMLYIVRQPKLCSIILKSAPKTHKHAHTFHYKGHYNKRVRQPVTI